MRLNILPEALPAFLAGTRTGTDVLQAQNERAAEIVVVLFCIVVGCSLQRWGAHRAWPHIAATLVTIVGSGIVAARFTITLPVLPLLIGAAGTLVVVQVKGLWRADLQLTRILVRSARSLRFIKTSEVTARLTSGLKLLNTVLPLNEAIVFRGSSTQPFQLVSRLKGSNSSQRETSRNSLWRDGVKLCEKAVKDCELIIQPAEGGGSTVAVPLSHEQETVGVLLLRLTSDFCHDDRPLLQAVGSQFARNLKRHDFSTNPADNPSLGYFSRSSGQKKLDSLHVLKDSLTEQRCEANALAYINDGIAIAYLDGTLALTNPALLRFAGLSSEQVRNLDLLDLLNSFRTGVFDEPAIAVRRVLQTGIDYEGELTFSEQGQTIGLRISLLSEKQTDAQAPAEPIGIAVYVRELTKVKEYEKLKSDMISLMSHELRTPLTSINGFAELLSADKTIPDQTREFVTIIANESQRMSRMINTFLAVTQLQRKDKQEVLKIPLRLDEVVRETIATLQPVAKKKRIRLVEQPAQRVPPVAADKSLITQAVKNLVHNAIKYSPERTTVTVSTALEAERVRVSVEDRGFGIPSESRDRVWDKFYRVVREGQEKDEESTGLGLSFVREVVEQHGGSVELDSEEGRGSRFSFTLPRL